MRCSGVLVFTTGFALVAASVPAQEQRSAPVASVSEFPRLDLSVHGGPLYPSGSDPEAKSSGVQLALEPIFRLNAYWGVGLSAQYARLGYRSRATGEDAGDVYLTQASVVGRFTPLADSNWHPYVQLGAGVGDYVQVPKCRFCSVADVVLLSAAVGGEYSITQRVRLGLSVTAFLFGLGVAEAGVDAPEGTPAPASPPWSQVGIAPRLSITTVWGAYEQVEAQTAGTPSEPARANEQDDYPRLDLSLHGGPLYPLQTDPSVTSLGLQTALESVVRLNPYFGVGLAAQYAQLNFESAGTNAIARGANAGRIYLTQAALIGRTTPLGDSKWVPYLQLGVGTGEYVSVPQCTCSVLDLVSLSAASGLEYEVVSALRLGLSITAFSFGLGARTPLSDPGLPPVSPSPTEQLEQTAPRWPRWGVAPRLSVTTVWK